MGQIADRFKGFLVAVLITAGAIYLLIVIGSRSSRVPSSIGVASVAVGSDGRLNNGLPSIPVALDEDLLPQLMNAGAPRASTDLSSMSGRVFVVQSDIPVRVSESSRRGLRVRILTGSDKGRSGWVPHEWVKPTR